MVGKADAGPDPATFLARVPMLRWCPWSRPLTGQVSEANRRPAAHRWLRCCSSDALAGAALQSQVQRLPATRGAGLSSMEMLPAEQRAGYRRIGLRVAGSWPVLIALLRGIEQGTPHMLVDDLQLRAPPVELRTASTPVSAAFTVVAFRAAPSEHGE